jgi:hypothetical protein
MAPTNHTMKTTFAVVSKLYISMPTPK